MQTPLGSLPCPQSLQKDAQGSIYSCSSLGVRRLGAPSAFCLLGSGGAPAPARSSSGRCCHLEDRVTTIVSFQSTGEDFFFSSVKRFTAAFWVRG